MEHIEFEGKILEQVSFFFFFFFGALRILIVKSGDKHIKWVLYYAQLQVQKFVFGVYYVYLI